MKKAILFIIIVLSSVCASAQGDVRKRDLKTIDGVSLLGGGQDISVSSLGYLKTAGVRTQIKADIRHTAYKVDSIHQASSYKTDFFYAAETIVADSIICTFIGGDGTPNITPKLGYGTSPGSLTYLITSPSAMTTNITKYYTFNNATIPQGNLLYLTFSAVGEAAREFTVYFYYHKY